MVTRNDGKETLIYDKDAVRFIWVTTPEGIEKRLPTIQTKDGYYTVLDPKTLESRETILADEQKSLEAKGVLTEVDDKTAIKAILRCEFIFEMWRVLGGSSKISGLTEEQIKVVENIASPETYYNNAVKWLVKVGKGYVSRLYDWVDVSNPITWGEVAYLLYIEFGFPKKLDWLKVGEGYSTAVLFHEDGENTTLVMDLNNYKSTAYLSDYLVHIRRGIRHLPYPMVGAYEELKNGGIVNHLRKDDILREVTRKEAKVLFNRILKMTGKGN